MEIKTLYVQWDFIKKSVCSTCLSKDRSLTLANTMEHLLRPFPGLHFGRYDRICWECKAMLKKITMFYKRAQTAQALFGAAVKQGGINKLQSLSRLEIMKPKSCSKCIPHEETIKTEDELRDCLDAELSVVKLEPEVTLAHSPGDSVKLEPEVTDHSSANSPSRDSETETSSETEKLALLNEKIEPQWMEVTVEVSPKIVPVAKEKLIDFDTKTGKYYKDIFKAVSLTDNDLATMRQKKLSNSKFCNNSKKCLKCIESFHNEKALEMHAVKHQDISGLFECKICEQRWHTQAALDEHTKSHYILFACLFCKQKFTDLLKALSHYDSFHYESNRQCKDCPQTFSTKRLLARHRNKVHGTKFPCPHCDKTFTLRYKLNSHIRVHKEVAKHECPICHKKYRGANGLKHHTQLKHENKANQPEYCVKCDIQFPTAYALQNHLATSVKHKSYQDLKYECDPCGKRFSCKRSLQTHLEYRHDNREYKCDHCTSVFKSFMYLRTHIRTKHEKKPKPKSRNFVCHVCGKAYHERPTLEQHLFAHRGYRPFVCDICSADFSHSGAMYTHKRLKHGYKTKKTQNQKEP